MYLYWCWFHQLDDIVCWETYIFGTMSSLNSVNETYVNSYCIDVFACLGFQYSYYIDVFAYV